MAENIDNRRSSTIEGHKKIDHGLEAIAIFKLVKGVLLLLVGTGAAKLIHVDVYDLALQWVEVLHVDADNRYIHWLLRKLMFVDERTLRHLSGGTFVYAAIVITEGVGLLRQKVWAEYLTVIATASLIPLEIFEIYKRFTVLRLGVIGINLAVVGYLIFMLRNKNARQIHASPRSE
jgi:uncharacterized membrane protein (DUF2068 family)